MAITISEERGLSSEHGDGLSLECPYCGVFAHMRQQSAPSASQLLEDTPKHVGVVYQCDACRAPVFLRFAVKEYREDEVELYQNFVELERPKERFSYSYLPDETQTLFREALACYSGGNFNAFASMSRRAALSAFHALGEGGKLRAFEEVMEAQDIAGIDDRTFLPIKSILFEGGDEEDLPLLDRVQAGILLETMKDMLYQLFVRRGKLTRAIKVRQFFVEEAGNDRTTAGPKAV
jgi:hypothetical protein